MHQTIAEVIRAIVPLDEIESSHIRDALDWVDSGVPLCRVEKPDIPPKHLVSYFAVLDPARRKVLLVDHVKAGLWLPNGGHVEPGESDRDGA